MYKHHGGAGWYGEFRCCGAGVLWCCCGVVGFRCWCDALGLWYVQPPPPRHPYSVHQPPPYHPGTHTVCISPPPYHPGTHTVCISPHHTTQAPIQCASAPTIPPRHPYSVHQLPPYHPGTHTVCISPHHTTQAPSIIITKYYHTMARLLSIIIQWPGY